MDQTNQTTSPEISQEDTGLQDGAARPILRVNRSDSGTRGKTASELDSEINLDSPELYINRELSHLQFNIRVLEQALDVSHPLLNRLIFLLIFSSNLDEFFEIRVAGLKRQIAFSRETSDIDGLMPQELLRRISDICHVEIERQYRILNDVLIPALEEENIRFLRRQNWSKEQSDWVFDYFRDQIQPVISPIGLDPSHPFPRLVNKSLNFIVSLEGKDAFGREGGLAIIPAPRSLPRLIRVPDEISDVGDNFVFLSSMIHAHADKLFPGMQVKGCYQFRLTRNADLIVDPEEVSDLASALRGELLSRRYGDAVRLEVVDTCPQELIDVLLKQFNLTDQELYKVEGPVNLNRLMAVMGELNRPNLLYPPFTPGTSKPLRRGNSIFEAMQQNDILLQHPFESFTPIEDLLREAARDPQVLAIKQTLYRTGADSEIVNALVEAARNNKEVTVVIELRARFDEADNLQLASRLQEAGAVVIYGVVAYKTHAKMMHIVRREGTKIRYYAHLGTGNYHAKTAKLYTDYSLLTSDPALCEDVHKVFMQLSGMGKTLNMKQLLHAPFTLHKSLIEKIEREAELAAKGKPARLIFKCNSLTEPKIIKALYKASQAGVEVNLIVRGMCCLRAGVKDVSENITVRSVVGRFLEHTRVYYFQNGGNEEIYCASADLMERNLFKRVETCFPINAKKLAQRVKNDLETYLLDNCQSWVLQTDGSYSAVTQAEGTDEVSAQETLLDAYAQR
ncbi:polyphosphate kinase [Oceanospirillum multiglobuliferum]|uniref:Polyphosphate kinase n=1 Tax=Oceanospirillum multiglobuliferum TaxID=64969 RepID=A0A1T4S292_9GAMM|nr:polyphosphate kinase 1 [Oceanospirillum multiglobuliferum]OPX54475.1 polyphosphate kinase 1 [Oceanospirillum multiglobuliferum]SKA22354.1 polyphosphate kinase [Oceanospirillum multiglobuliferum]